MGSQALKGQGSCDDAPWVGEPRVGALRRREDSFFYVAQKATQSHAQVCKSAPRSATPRRVLQVRAELWKGSGIEIATPIPIMDEIDCGPALLACK